MDRLPFGAIAVRWPLNFTPQSFGSKLLSQTAVEHSSISDIRARDGIVGITDLSMPHTGIPDALLRMRDQVG